MNTELSASSECYKVVDGDEAVAFAAIIHFPHPKNKRLKTVHRLVVRPDYQGIGIGTKFLDWLGMHYAEQNMDLKITTSAQNLILALKRRKMWQCVRYGTKKPQSASSQLAGLTKRNNIKTASFFYKR